MRAITISALLALALLSLVSPRSGLAEEIKCEGSITKIEGANVTVKGPTDERQIKIEPATKIIIRGKPGSAMDLKVGQQVKCVCDKQDESVVCTTLEIMRDQNGL